jgi:hypothetical protein
MGKCYIGAMSLSIPTLGIATLSTMGLFATLSINDTLHNSIECHYADCRIFYCVVMLNVVKLSVITMSTAGQLVLVRIALTLRVVLDEDGDLFGRLGQLVSCLLGGGLPEVDPIVLQDLVGASKSDLKINDLQN